MSQPNLNGGIQDIRSAGSVLVAAICGTDAADDCVLSFTAANVVQAGIGLAAANAAGTGTQIACTQPLLLDCTLSYAVTGTATVNTLGISRNATGAERGGDAPAVPNYVTMFAVGRTLEGTAANEIINTLHTLIPVSAAQAAVAGGGVIRFHAGDGAGATPAGGDVFEARCWYSVTAVSVLDA